MMLPSVCVATLRGCTARPASRPRWCRPTTGVGEDGVPSPDGQTCVPALQPTLKTQARRTMCRSTADVLPTSIASESDRDIGRGRHTRSAGGSTRRRRGRENLPSRPTIWGMTSLIGRRSANDPSAGSMLTVSLIGGKCQASTCTSASGPFAPVYRRAGGFFYASEAMLRQVEPRDAPYRVGRGEFR
jgi:hypothetical protein